MPRKQIFTRCNKGEQPNKKYSAEAKEKRDPPDPISNTNKRQPAIDSNAVLNKELDDNY